MPINPEGQQGSFLREAMEKWQEFIDGLGGKGLNIAEFTFSELAVVLGISKEKLKRLSGRHLGIEITKKGALISFFPEINLRRKAYQISAALLQLSVSGQAEIYWQNLERENPTLVDKLVKVPGFSDLAESVLSGATPCHEGETIFQHLWLAALYASLPPVEQEGLLKPEQVFTRPG